MADQEKCALAYSGGLDTSAMVPWLVDQGFEVHAVLVDVGQDEDLPALCDNALTLGATTAVIRDAKPAMCEQAIRYAISLAATYEGTYRLGTALARPFIALEQIRLAKQLGGATLIHGATGKGNDQIRFEFAYRALAPECPVLAPWKVWDFKGREDLADFLIAKGFESNHAITKEYSLDENLWHLSIEGSSLEDPRAKLNVRSILATFADRFAGGVNAEPAPSSVQIEFFEGVPLAMDGVPMPLTTMITELNRRYRAADWAWDLVIENRFTGIKSRGIYLNPAAKLFHHAADALARCCFNKRTYDQWAELGNTYAGVLYRGEYFSQQHDMVTTAAEALMKHMSGTVTIQITPTPYVASIDAPGSIFSKDLATFEASDYDHHDAAGFIRLSWLTSIGKTCKEIDHEGTLERAGETSSDVRSNQSMPRRGLVPAALRAEAPTGARQGAAGGQDSLEPGV